MGNGASRPAPKAPSKAVSRQNSGSFKSAKGGASLGKVSKQSSATKLVKASSFKRKFKIGDKVKGKYKNGSWYGAVVADYAGDKYVLRWDDGDTQDTLKAEVDLRGRNEQQAQGGDTTLGSLGNGSGEDQGVAEPSGFKVGDKVKGRYKNGNWYTAVIAATAGDKFVLAWDDGDPADTIKGPEDLQHRQDLVSKYNVGDEVQAKYQNGTWYDATIADVDGNVYVVEWADGDLMDTIKVEQEIKPRGAGNSGDVATEPQELLDALGASGVEEEVEKMGGSMTSTQLSEVLQKHGKAVDEAALENLFDSLDSDCDGHVSLAEVKRALRMQSAQVAPEVQVMNFLEDSGMIKRLVSLFVANLGAAGVKPEDAMPEVVAKYSRDKFEAFLDSAKAELADCMEAQRVTIQESEQLKGEAAAANSKFASGQDVFEGAYGGMDDFLDGLDAIGLPQPKTYQGMVSDFTLGQDSNDEFTTSNYGGMRTTPAQEWEFVSNPTPGKVYPGGRLGVKLEVFLRAVAAQGYQEELAKMERAMQGEVCVVLLRRIKAQLAPRGFKKATGKPADLVTVARICARLDEVLSEERGGDGRTPEATPSRKTRKHGKEAKTEREAAAVATVGGAPTWEKVVKGMSGLIGEEDLRALVVHERARLRKAKLTKEEVIGVRLYTGPSFVKMNAVLRKSSGKFPESMWNHLKGNSYVSTIHACVSGMVKLSKVSQIPPERKVYRGMAGMRLPKCFWQADEMGARGGVEFGFMSTTTKREIAMQYLSGGKALATIFEIQVGMIDRGSSISFLSQFPGEEEILIPPRSNLEVVGDPFVEHTRSGPVIVIPARINCNIKAKTMEQIRQQRKHLHLSLVENLVKEVHRELDSVEYSQPFLARSKVDYNRGQDQLVESVRRECDEIVERHSEKKASWFNEDSNYKRILEEAINLKSMALGKIKYWMDNVEECASGVGGVDAKPMLQVQRLAHGKLYAALQLAKDEGDAAAVKEIAIQLCKEENLISAIKTEPKEGEKKKAWYDSDDDDDDGDEFDWWGAQEGGDEQSGMLERTDDNGETPLTTACASGRVRLVKLLVDAGSDVNGVDDRENTGLMVAAMGGHIDIIAFLISSGARVDERNSEGKSPLIKVAELGYVEACEALIDGGADINMGDTSGWNAVMWATQYNRIAVVKLLLERGAEVNATAGGGWTAMFDAATANLVDLGQVLIDGGIDVNAQRSSGSTAMHLAAQRGHVEFVELMLNNGGDPNIRGLNGSLPLGNAAEKGNVEMVKLLLKHGADPTIANDYGSTPIDLSRSESITKLLTDAAAKSKK